METRPFYPIWAAKSSIEPNPLFRRKFLERTNRPCSARIEFWNLYDGPLTIKQVAQHLANYEFFYNYQRPHASLAYQMPNEYLVALEAA